MGVVMLNRDLAGLGPGQGVAGRLVAGVQIMGDDFGLDADETLQARHRALVGSQGFQVVEIADVGAEIGIAALRQTEGILKVRPAGQKRRDRRRQNDRPGHIPARPTEQHRPARHHTADGIVAGGLDGATVHEPGVGNPGQPPLRIAVVERDGLFGEIPRGHDQRPLDLGKQQVVQRRIGQQESDHRVVGRHLGGQPRVGLTPHQNDGPLDRRQQPQLRLVERSQRPGGVKIAHHHRKGLLVALLAFTQAGHRRR